MRVVIPMVVLLAGCSSPPSADEQRVADATRVARTYAAEEDATISAATATWSRGTVANPNTAETCESGELVRIALTGSFPHIVTTGGPAGGDGTSGVVTGVYLTADAQTGKVCKVSVTTGQVRGYATDLHLG